jgi:hypothetical protein
MILEAMSVLRKSELQGWSVLSPHRDKFREQRLRSAGLFIVPGLMSPEVDRLTRMSPRFEASLVWVSII